MTRRTRSTNTDEPASGPAVVTERRADCRHGLTCAGGSPQLGFPSDSYSEPVESPPAGRRLLTVRSSPENHRA